MNPRGQGSATEIRKEAAAWLVEMDDVSEAFDDRVFAKWLQASPRHIEEFLFLAATWRALNDMPRDKATDIERWVQRLAAVVPLREFNESTHNVESVRKAPRVVHSFRWAAAIGALALAGVWLWAVHGLTERNVLTTAVGEQRAVRLADRSVVHLNTDSRVEIRFTDRYRDVRLIHGEALFTVEHDASRPFRVITDRIQVQAVGTQFNVRRRAGDTIVSVVEGRVSVLATESVSVPPSDQAAGSSHVDLPEKQDVDTASPAGAVLTLPAETRHAAELAVLDAGQQARITMDGVVEERVSEDMKAATAWRQRQLVLNNTPLQEAIAELARYNDTPRLQIEDEAVRAIRIDGVFAADDPESLIQFLARNSELSVTRNGDTVVIRSR